MKMKDNRIPGSGPLLASGLDQCAVFFFRYASVVSRLNVDRFEYLKIFLNQVSSLMLSSPGEAALGSSGR
jgi:hypothetical protein